MSESSWKKELRLIAIILVAGAAVFSVLIMAKSTPEPQPLPEAPIAEVNVVLAQIRTEALRVSAQGTVKAKREIDLVAESTGKIIWVDDAFAEGGFFMKASPLVKIDARDYGFAVTGAESMVADARQLLATEKGRAIQAKREWRDLKNQDANNLSLRKPQLAAATAAVAAAEANRDQALLSLERTTISALFSGRIKNRYVDLGQYVTVGTRIATIYETSTVEIRLPLTDKQAALIALPLNPRILEVELDRPEVLVTGVIAGKRYEWQGTITRVEAGVDERSRMYFAIVEVENTLDEVTQPLIVGLFVDAEISGKNIEKVVSLPRTAVFKRNLVYSIDAEQKIQSKKVHVLKVTEDKVWIQGDIAEQEKIVIEKQGYFPPGRKVKPIVVPSESNAQLPEKTDLAAIQGQ